MQARAAAGVEAHVAVPHRRCELGCAFDEPRRPTITPVAGTGLVHGDGLSVHAPIITRMASTGLPGEERRVDDVPQAFAALVETEAPASIALSGGDTARHCYELLATADVDWRGVDVWFGDERWVPIHDPESNEGMARVTFLDEVEPREIHSLYGAADTIEGAALAYDDMLGDAPPIALLHLGMGPDGHTASLFPGSPTLDVTDRLVIPAGTSSTPIRGSRSRSPRSRGAQLAVITVAGAEKHEPLERVRAGDDLPVARVRARARRVARGRSRRERRVVSLACERREALDLVGAPLTDLMRDASRARDAAHGDRITFSPKVFIPLTMLCRDRCGYCTFAKPPARLDAPYLTDRRGARDREARRGARLPRGAVHPRRGTGGALPGGCRVARDPRLREHGRLPRGRGPTRCSRRPASSPTPTPAR